MTETLKKLQKKIYAEGEELVKLGKQASELKSKIDKAKKKFKSKKDIEKLEIEAAFKAESIDSHLELRKSLEADLNKRMKTLKEIIRTSEQSPENEHNKLQAQLKASGEAAKTAIVEISEYESYKEKQLNKHSKKYQENRDKLLSSLSRILDDPHGLRDILKPLAAKEETKKVEGIGGFAKVKAAAEGLAFAVSKPGVLIDIMSSREFYISEAQKIMSVLKKEEELDLHDLPFFIKLLKDEQVQVFLNKQGPKIVHLVEILAPLIAPIILKELGKIDAIAADIKDKSGAIKALPAKEVKLEELKKGNLEENRHIIIPLGEEIVSLRNLLSRERIAIAINKLRIQGLGEEFITENLLPIIIETFKELLNKPKDLTDIASAAIYFISPSNQDEKKIALKQIFDKVDINRLLQNGKLAEFLRLQSVALTEIINTLIDASPKVSSLMGEMGINKSIIASALQTFVPIAGEMLKAPGAEITDRFKEALFDITLSDLEEQKRKAQSLDDLAKLDKEHDQQKLKVAKLLTELFLQGNITDSALNNIPVFFRKNQAIIEEALHKVWPIFINVIDERIDNLVRQYNPDLDKIAAKKVILPPLELLKVIDPILVKKSVPVFISFIEALTNVASREDALKVYYSINLLTSNLSVAADKELAQVELRTSIIKILGSEKMNLALRALGEFIGNVENIPAITIIANKAIADSAVLQELGLTPSFIESTIPLVAAMTNATLASGDQLAPFAQAFAYYYRGTEHGSSESNKSLEVIVKSGPIIMESLSPVLKNDLATYLQNNKQELENIVSNSIPATKPFASLIPAVIDLTANILPLATDGAKALLPEINILAEIAGDFNSYQTHGKQLREEDLGHEVRLELQESRNNLLSNIINQSLNLVKLTKVSKLIEDDIPKFLEVNRDAIIDLTIKAMENPDINTLNVSPDLVCAIAPLVIDTTAKLLPNTKEIGDIVNKTRELVTNKSGDRQQKINTLVDSIIFLKENNIGIRDLIDTKIPDLFAKHSEELGKIVDNFLKQNEKGKALRDRGKQIVNIVGKKFPEAVELAERYAKGDRVSLIPKVLKLLFNKEVLGLVINVISDLTRNAWNKSTNKSSNSDVSKLMQETDKPALALNAQDQRLLKEVVDSLQGSRALSQNQDNVSHDITINNRKKEEEISTRKR